MAIHNDKKLKEDLHVLSVNPSDMAAFVDFLREVSNDLGLVPVAPIGTPSPLSAP